MLDPYQYCPRCSRRYGITEESCSGCGFDPVNSDKDAAVQDRAVAQYKENKQ